MKIEKVNVVKANEQFEWKSFSFLYFIQQRQKQGLISHAAIFLNGKLYLSIGKIRSSLINYQCTVLLHPW